MKKLLLAICALPLLWGAALAQPSTQKIIFPNQGSSIAQGLHSIQTTDDGFLLTGVDIDPFSGYLPRLIKLDANLQVQWDKTYMEQSPPVYQTIWPNSPAMQTPDGGFLMVLLNYQEGPDLVLLDANGEVVWEKELVQDYGLIRLLKVLNDGSSLVSIHYPNVWPYNFNLLHLDSNGEIITQKTLVSENTYVNFRSIPLANDRVLTAYRDWDGSAYLGKFLCTDLAGNTVWEKQGPDFFNGFPETKYATMTAMPDGGFSLLSHQIPKTIYRFDANGNQIWQSPSSAIPATLRPENIVVNATGQYVLSGSTLANRGFVAQLNASGDGVEWSMESPEDGQNHIDTLSAIPTNNGWAAGVGSTQAYEMGFIYAASNTGTAVHTLSGRVAKDDDADCTVAATESGLCQAHVVASNSSNTYHYFTDCTGNYELFLPAGTFSVSVYPNEPFFDLCTSINTSVSFPVGTNTSLSLDLPMESPELIHEVRGVLRLDANDNCLPEPDESLLPYWTVELKTTSGNSLYLTTNDQGEYKTFVPNGSYEVSVHPYNLNFLACAPSSHVFNLAGPDPQTEVHDFTINQDTSCSGMRAELGHSPIRPCTTATIYAYYRNDGAAMAENASLTVTLDPLLTYLSATQTPDIIDGQSLTFNLGNVSSNPGGNWFDLEIQVSADCALVMGDQVCVSASVTPQELCFWSGAAVEVTGTCDENEEEGIFTIKNVGTSPNVVQLEYVITEDQIVLRTGQFQLAPGQMIMDTVPGNGLPLTIIADQEPGFPGDTSVVWNILNCGGNGSGQWTGFGGSSGPYTHQECFLVTSSFDPNDIDATPQGRGPEHLVHPGTPLEYRIRFQNTGNDTAFLVVIRDTLPEQLDFSSIETRASSHPFKFAQINNNVVQFTFENILLPDSNTNVAASQGFVEFEVYPKKDLADGTQVFNRAAIYFDYNAPVLTNRLLRTYGQYLLLTTDESPDLTLPVKANPNPFITETMFQLPSDAPLGDYRLEIRNALGQTLRTQSFEGYFCPLKRANLPAGMLFWNVLRGQKRVASGKILAID